MNLIGLGLSPHLEEPPVTPAPPAEPADPDPARKPHQAMVEIGRRAMTSLPIEALLAEAARLIASALEIPFCAILECRPDENDLLLAAGAGWRDGSVGTARIASAFSGDGAPMIIADLAAAGAAAAPFLTEHGIRSTASVLIDGRRGPWGVLQIARRTPGAFSDFAIDFLQSAASLLALAIENRHAEARASRHLAHEAHVRFFYEHSFDLHAVLSEWGEGQFLYEEVNPAVLHLYEKSREEVVGRKLEEVIGAENATQVTRHFLEALRSGEPHHYERNEGRSIVEAAITPVPSEAGQPRKVLITARDVTERRQLQEQLHQAQKMEAVGQLTGGVAHDFNNLLTVVIGNLDQLEMRATDERARRLIAAARRGADRAAMLTHRLLAFSRKQPLDPKPIDLNKLIAGLSDMLRRSLGEKVAIETMLADRLWQTSADPNQLENALLNLALNGRDAMPEGGKLTIETANTYLDPRYAEAHSEVTPGLYVLLAVTDTGVGMSPETLARAFEPFFTTKEVGYGSGLGLSMIYGFVKQSGGHIVIHSDPGRGTTVELYLPRRQTTDRAEPATAPTAAPSHPRSGRGETILVVEDNEEVRQYTVGMLRELGYIVIEARHAGDALKLADSDCSIDLLFTDIGLPGGITGRDLARALCRQRPGLKVLLTTGYPAAAVVRNDPLDPGVLLVGKPFTLRQVAIRIRSLLDGAC